MRARNVLAVILRSRALARRLEGWKQALAAASFEARRYAASTSG
jgi:hypothetical protein